MAAAAVVEEVEAAAAAGAATRTVVPSQKYKTTTTTAKNNCRPLPALAANTTKPIPVKLPSCVLLFVLSTGLIVTVRCFIATLGD